MKIYVVTTICDIIDNGEDKFPDIEGVRSVGYFEKLEDAKKCIENNTFDINEAGYYKYVVIEEVKPGLYGTWEPHSIFYKWDGKKYQPSEKPECTNCYVSFSQIG